MKILCLTPLLAALLLTPVLRAEEAKPDPIEAIKAQLKDASQPFTLMVEMNIKEDKLKDFQKVARPAVNKTRKEPGNLAYEIHQDAADACKFVFFEKWRSIDALRAHIAMDYTTALLTKADEISSQPMTIKVLTPFIAPKPKSAPSATPAPADPAQPTPTPATEEKKPEPPNTEEKTPTN